MGALEGVQVSLVGLGPLNWVGRKVDILASPEQTLSSFSELKAIAGNSGSCDRNDNEHSCSAHPGIAQVIISSSYCFGQTIIILIEAWCRIYFLQE